MDGLVLGWEEVLPRLAARAVERHDEAAGAGAPVGGLPAGDPLTWLARLVAAPDPVAAVNGAAEGLGLVVRVSSLDGVAPLADGPEFVGAGLEPRERARQEALLWELLARALDAADAGHLWGVPAGGERTALLRAWDAVQAGGMAAATVARVSAVLSWAAPRQFLSLEGPSGALLRAPEGLGVCEADVPATPLEYLSLVAFLGDEMDAARLPYRDFLELAHAAAEGRTLAEGLADADRRALVRGRIAPELARLWPRDPDRVELELQALLGPARA